MTRTNDSRSWPAPLTGLLRLPVLWGGLATAAFYGLFHLGLLHGPLLERYFASHPVGYVSTGLFFVGLAALAIKWIDVRLAGSAPREPLLGPLPEVRQPPRQAELLLSVLQRQQPSLRRTYLARRLEKGLEKIKLKGSADGVEGELRNLADDGAVSAHQSYALVRIIVWAIPILGFLGTVIGITLAVAELKPTNLDEIGPVVAGLSVAFDTTALALALSIVLMFTMFFATQAENKALARAEARAEAELVGRFERSAAINDPSSDAIRAATEEMLRRTEQIVERQAEVWRATIDAAHQRWNQLTQATEQQLAAALQTALTASLAEHHRQLQQSEQTAGDQARGRWEQLLAALQNNTAAVAGQQTELRKQAEIMLQTVDAAGRVAELEDALNGNLAALARAGNFEETVHNLNAAIALLAARAGSPAAPSPVALKPKKGQAA